MAGASTTPKVDLPEAVTMAKLYLTKVYPQVPAGSVLVEEVEFLTDEAEWQITLSFEAPRLETSNATKTIVEAARAWNGYVDRAYKLFRVSSETGQVIAMKIRQL